MPKVIRKKRSFDSTSGSLLNRCVCVRALDREGFWGKDFALFQMVYKKRVGKWLQSIGNIREAPFITTSIVDIVHNEDN